MEVFWHKQTHFTALRGYGYTYLHLFQSRWPKMVTLRNRKNIWKWKHPNYFIEMPYYLDQNYSPTRIIVACCKTNSDRTLTWWICILECRCAFICANRQASNSSRTNRLPWIWLMCKQTMWTAESFIIISSFNPTLYDPTTNVPKLYLIYSLHKFPS